MVKSAEMKGWMKAIVVGVVTSVIATIVIKKFIDKNGQAQAAV